jgi:hypothetical protein
VSTTTVNLKDYYSIKEQAQVVDNPFLSDALGDLIRDKENTDLTFCFIYNSNTSQELLGQIFETLHAPASEMSQNKLLQLALRNNPANGGKVTIDGIEYAGGFRIAAIKKFVDSAGNVTYTPIIAKDKDGNLAMGSSEISIDALSKYWNVPYFAMAMCYEMALVVKEMIIAQVDAIDKANKEIKENNEYLEYANTAYHNYYTWAIYKNETTSIPIINAFELEKNADGTTTPSGLPTDAQKHVADFLNYLKVKCGLGNREESGKTIKGEIGDETGQININSQISYGTYNTEGKSGGDRSNIDVKEQEFLTHISSWQEAIRQRGDLLSTDAQEMTTKLTQYVQAFNNNLQGCSDMNKGIYSSTRVVTSNIRL